MIGQLIPESDSGLPKENKREQLKKGLRVIVYAALLMPKQMLFVPALTEFKVDQIIELIERVIISEDEAKLERIVKSLFELCPRNCGLINFGYFKIRACEANPAKAAIEKLEIFLFGIINKYEFSVTTDQFDMDDYPHKGSMLKQLDLQLDKNILELS